MSVAIVVMINSTALLLEQQEERALITPFNLLNQSDILNHQSVLACPTLGNVNHLNASELASRNAKVLPNQRSFKILIENFLYISARWAICMVRTYPRPGFRSLLLGLHSNPDSRW